MGPDPFAQVGEATHFAEPIYPSYKRNLWLFILASLSARGRTLVLSFSLLCFHFLADCSIPRVHPIPMEVFLPSLVNVSFLMSGCFSLCAKGGPSILLEAIIYSSQDSLLGVSFLSWFCTLNPLSL